jgi:hypothetical protein
MGKPSISSSPQFSRRAFFGWFISLGGAAVFLTFVAGAEGVLSTLPGLFSKSPKRGSKLGHDRAKRARTRRKRFAKQATLNHELVIVERRYPPTKVRSSVVHWPHQALFTPRLLLKKNAPTLPGDSWKDRVHPHCGLDELTSKASTTHFYAAHDGVIREQLCLACLSLNASSELHGAEDAMAILSPLFDDDRQRCNWRLYHLFARLACWAETSPEQARARILTTAWKRPMSGDMPKQLEFLNSDQEFHRWYVKSKSDRFVRRLHKRIEFAQSLRWGQSSSGQDTASAERDRSNRPRPLPKKLQTDRRRQKLHRRKERRARRKTFGFQDRIKILIGRFRRELGSDSDTDAKSNPATMQSPVLKPYRTDHHRKALPRMRKARCTVSRRHIPSIPIRRRSSRPGGLFHKENGLDLGNPNRPPTP